MSEKEYDVMEWNELEPEEGYTQMCVWPGTVVEQDDMDGGELDNFFNATFNLEHPIRAVGCVTTLPDRKNGKAVEGTGGRHDFVFFVHSDDIGKFAVPRLQFGIRWWEDVVGNKSHNIYPSSFRNYGKEVYSW